MMTTILALCGIGLILAGYFVGYIRGFEDADQRRMARKEMNRVG